MTSVAVQYPQQQSSEIFESTTSYDENVEHTSMPDVEMTEIETQEELIDDGNAYDDQDTLSGEIESTVVEPPQSDVVITNAPSTILDESELEYLEEVEYEVTEITSKNPDDILVHESETTYKETTIPQTPPAISTTSSERHIHPIFSPASRMIPGPRPVTPLINTNLPTNAEDDVDDDWPICLYTPNGQEYVLFRSDGDTEALFEDSWLKSQPLESLFSSIRQTLESELASVTTSFAMDEIVLTIPDLEVSIAEDNCYTRDISLQDLVNLINGLCAKNGTERANTCRLQLSLQPRFIARFNQLVSLTSTAWSSTRPKTEEEPVADEEGQEESGEDHEDEGYYEYEGDENAEHLEEYEEPTEQNQVKFQDHHEEEEEEEAPQDTLTAAEEDEVYEENDDAFDQPIESTEGLVNEDDVVEVEEDNQEEEYEEQHYEDDQGEEEHQEEQVNPADYTEEQDELPTEQDTAVHADEDDLISYEEAADQTEEGQDYRQHYIDEETSQDQQQNGQLNGTQVQPESHNEIPESKENAQHLDLPESNQHTQPDSSNTKRRIDETLDTSTQEQPPPAKRAKSIS